MFQFCFNLSSQKQDSRAETIASGVTEQTQEDDDIVSQTPNLVSTTLLPDFVLSSCEFCLRHIQEPHDSHDWHLFSVAGKPIRFANVHGHRSTSTNTGSGQYSTHVSCAKAFEAPQRVACSLFPVGIVSWQISLF